MKIENLGKVESLSKMLKNRQRDIDVIRNANTGISISAGNNIRCVGELFTDDETRIIRMISLNAKQREIDGIIGKLAELGVAVTTDDDKLMDEIMDAINDVLAEASVEWHEGGRAGSSINYNSAEMSEAIRAIINK